MRFPPILKTLSRYFWRDSSANVSVSLAFAIFPLMGIVGASVDYANALKAKSFLQGVADQSALASARQLRLGNSTQAMVQQSAQYAANLALAGKPWSPTVGASVPADLSAVTVNIAATIPTYLSQLLNLPQSSVSVTSRARVLGVPALCLLSLDPTASKGISVSMHSNVAAPGCSVYSNSRQTSSITVTDSSVVTASMGCAAGGVVGTAANIIPMPLTDCPDISDPLAGRATPAVSSTCDHTNKVIVLQTVTIDPGVYCGGLQIDLLANVTMNPGVYVIKGGSFNVIAAKVKGTGVTIYLTGANTNVDLVLGSTIDLTAPATGATAGILIWEDAATTTPNIMHYIYSTHAHNLLGTIYFPNGNLMIGSPNAVADQSAYTIIVAKTLSLVASPNLNLNANYNATNVPVPAGLGPTSQGAFLDM